MNACSAVAGCSWWKISSLPWHSGPLDDLAAPVELLERDAELLQQPRLLLVAAAVGVPDRLLEPVAGDVADERQRVERVVLPAVEQRRPQDPRLRVLGAADRVVPQVVEVVEAVRGRLEHPDRVRAAAAAR
jgi:hypothetical protein